MDPWETVNEKQEIKDVDSVNVLKASILNRGIARSIDILIVIALFETLSKAGYFAGLLYILIADGLFDGRSVGKWLIGVRVIVSDTKSPCTYKESIIRNLPFAIGYIFFGLLKGIPLVGWLFAVVIPIIILGIEALIMIGNDNRRRFGDEVAKTCVIEASIGG